jgi:hypothetical protein
VSWSQGLRLAYCSVSWKLVPAHPPGHPRLVAGEHDRLWAGKPLFAYRRRQPVDLRPCRGVGEPVTD